MSRWITTMLAMICISTCTAQSMWTEADMWLQKFHTEVSLAPMVGISYFQYDTKAIVPHFVTAELSLELLFSTEIADHWKVQYGMLASYKGTSGVYYYHSTPYESIIYRTKDIDSLMSQYGHGSWGLPLKVQYHPGKFGLTLGVMPRYFVMNGDPARYPIDLLKGKFDMGAVAGIGVPLRRFRLGFEFYFGLINMYDYEPPVAGGPQYVEYRLFNRSGQFLFRYTIGKKPERP